MEGFVRKYKYSVLLIKSYYLKKERDRDAVWKVPCQRADPVLARKGTAILSRALWQHKAGSPGPRKRMMIFHTASDLWKLRIPLPPSEHSGDHGTCGNSGRYLSLPRVAADPDGATGPIEILGRKSLSSQKRGIQSSYRPLLAIYIT